MFENTEERRRAEKVRTIAESKATASRISTFLFVLFVLFVVSLIITLTKGSDTTLQSVVTYSWINVLVYIAIGVITILVPDYDGACKRAGGCLLGAFALVFILAASGVDGGVGMLLLVVLVDIVLIIIYYESFAYEMAGRVSSLSSAACTVWKAIGISFLCCYIGLIFLLLAALGLDSYDSLKTYTNLLKLDVYATNAAQIAFDVMLLVTAIMLKNYADSPITVDGQVYSSSTLTPIGPAMMPPQGYPYNPAGMQQPGQPYPQVGMPPQAPSYPQQYPQTGMSQAPQPYAAPAATPYQGQPYPQTGMPSPYAPVPMAPQGQPYPQQSYAPPYSSPMGNIVRTRMPAPNEWQCSCGRINPNYTGTCACGIKKSELTGSRNKRPARDAAPSSRPAAPKASAANEAENIRLLKEYKTLLDNGIISQEEFEKKKNDLLHKN